MNHGYKHTITLVFCRRPEVPGFCPSIGAVGTLVISILWRDRVVALLFFLPRKIAMVSVLPKLAHFILWAVRFPSRGVWAAPPCTGACFVAFEPPCWCAATVPRVGTLDLASLVQRLAPAACPKFGRRAYGGHRACTRARIAPRRWWRSKLGRNPRQGREAAIGKSTVLGSPLRSWYIAPASKPLITCYVLRSVTCKKWAHLDLWL